MISNVYVQNYVHTTEIFKMLSNELSTKKIIFIYIILNVIKLTISKQLKRVIF